MMVLSEEQVRVLEDAAFKSVVMLLVDYENPSDPASPCVAVSVRLLRDVARWLFNVRDIDAGLAEALIDTAWCERQMLIGQIVSFPSVRLEDS